MSRPGSPASETCSSFAGWPGRLAALVPLLVLTLLLHGCSSGYSRMPATGATHVRTKGEADWRSSQGGWGGLPETVHRPAGDPTDLPPLSAREELWVVERSEPGVDFPGPELTLSEGEGKAVSGTPVEGSGRTEASARRSLALADVPGGGGLLARPAGGTKDLPVPLEHTNVKARVSGTLGVVDVQQRFRNGFSEKIEAVYVFPLPHDAAVTDFVLTIGERRIRGIVRERAEAERIYREARSQGYVASLLTQERPNVFTQKVANLEPGKSIEVRIQYFQQLACVDGAYEFVYPMVVGPRFNPPGSTSGIGAVARRSEGASGRPVEVSYLRPRERSGHDIAVEVELDAGTAIEELTSPSHAIVAERPGEGRARVRLSPLDRVPNKDFVLRYRVAGQTVKSALLTQRDERGGFFTLTLYPPESAESVERRPVEMVFVLDCSGSMSGAPLAKAKLAIERALRRLEPGDSFQLVRFSDKASLLGVAPLEATPENVRRGLAHLASLESEGGTMMLEGIRAALAFPHDPGRFRMVLFLTDGYIGNEAEILAEIGRRVGPARLFSFGIGTSVNRGLLEEMARVGRGAVAYLGLDESAGREIDLFYERIRRPVLTDLTVDWGGLSVSEVLPSRIPDLFTGRPIVLTGRFDPQGAADGAASIRVRGNAGDATRELVIRPAAAAADRPATHPGLPYLWARSKIADLTRASLSGEDPRLAEGIRRIALEFGLVSAYTAFVAVDTLSPTAGASGVSVQVPVPVPEGVRYETTVPERRRPTRAAARER
ncbi:MAG: VWA domain-containing protein [Planctomycetes bacterium]|nr:VWA domain-containing protein [Planctomycetota bacterium]